MPLNITTGGMSARGFGFTTQGYYNLNLTISSNTTSYNVATAALAAGWTGTNPLNLKLTINPGVTVSGTGNGTSAAILLTSLFAKSIITINNSGTVVGSAGSAGGSSGGSGAVYSGNPASVSGSTFPNNYAGTGYPTGPGAGGSTPGYSFFSGGTSPPAGSGSAGGAAIYLASNIYLIVNNSATGLITGGGGGGGGQAGNNASGGSGGNGGYCIQETGSHPIAIANNISGGIISSGGGGSPGWGNRFEGDGVGGRPGNDGIRYILSAANFGAVGITAGLATNNTGNTLINTTGQFTLSPAV